MRYAPRSTQIKLSCSFSDLEWDPHASHKRSVKAFIQTKFRVVLRKSWIRMRQIMKELAKSVIYKSVTTPTILTWTLQHNVITCSFMLRCFSHSRSYSVFTTCSCRTNWSRKAMLAFHTGSVLQLKWFAFDDLVSTSKIQYHTSLHTWRF